MSMGASIELRTPLLDIEVAGIAARIPSCLKLPSGGPGKSVLRNAFGTRFLTSAKNPKIGFPIPQLVDRTLATTN